MFYATGNIYASNAITVTNVIATGNLFGLHLGTFSGSSFTGGTFSGSTVGATSITATNFTGTTFSGTTFTGTNFNGGTHTGAFTGSAFTGGTFYGSSVTSTGDVVAYASDDRLKNRLGNIPSAIEKVKSLNGFIFTWNDVANSYGYSDLEQHVGLSAQEIKAVLPQVIRPAPFDNGTTGNNYMTVQYEKVVPLLVEAIKEQSKQIEELRALCATVLSRQ